MDLGVARLISGHSLLAVTKDQISSELAGEAVILNLKSGAYYGLNDVGTLVWNLLQTPRSMSDLCQAILDEYEVEPERCEQDLLALLQELTSLGLIEIKDNEAA